MRLSPEQDYFLRFTVLYPPIFERFMARFLRGEGRPVIRLGRALINTRLDGWRGGIDSSSGVLGWHLSWSSNWCFHFGLNGCFRDT